MKAIVTSCSLVALCVAPLAPPYAAAPVKLSEVAAIEDLVAAAEANFALLDEHLQTEGAYSNAKKREIPRAAGVLACLAQAIVEHPDKDQTNVAAAALRDAAVELQTTDTYTDAAAVLERTKQAFQGSSSGCAEAEHAWNELINLHRLMEEVNSRNTKLRRALRRSREPQQESLDATTLAVLALAIHADTHEVKAESNIPKWQGYARELQTNMTALASAIKRQDSEEGKRLFLSAAKACNKCHDEFREH